ncbi:MAG: GH116 family glycosyl-hydrolase [Verrucomicrobiota bacterium]|jgi:uncharacterized protein (DUF608 family)
MTFAFRSSNTPAGLPRRRLKGCRREAWPAVLLAAVLHSASGQGALAAAFDPNTGTITDQQWQHGVPLGGIGTGKIELLSDGSFGNFTINNNWNAPYGWCQGAFAAICAQAGASPPVARMLRLSSGNEYQGVVRNVAHAQMQGWFPQANIQFTDVSLPVQVSVNAFAPLIPHDIKDSALPIACLTYTVTNSGSQTVSATVLLAWPNLLGFGGLGASDNKTNWNSVAGNSQTPLSTNGLTGLRFTTTQNYPGQQRQNVVGEYFVGVRASAGLTITTCTNWDASASTPSFWQGFSTNGTLTATNSAAQPAGAVAAEFALAPGQSRDVHFYVAWYMPHQMTQLQSVQGLVLASSNPTNTTSRWGTGCPQQTGFNVPLDLGQLWTPTQVLLDQGSYTTDYPRGIQVDISTDQSNWTTVATMTSAQVVAALGSGSQFTVPLQPSQGRYLRLTDLGWDDFYWWSIAALQVTVEEQGTALAFVPVSSLGPVVDNGHYYCNWFQSAAGVGAYVDGQSDSLLQQTTAWQLPIENSNLPFWLRLFLINCAFPTVANTVLTEDGMFTVQESPVNQNGNLGTMDQRMASHVFTVDFFPELDRAELELFAAEQLPSGCVPHCVGVLDDAINNPWVPYSRLPWPDLNCSWAMQVVKLCRWTGDTSLAQRMQPHLTNAMNYLALNHQGSDPIPQGGSTYDYVSLPYNGAGAFSYTASAYLGALEAATAQAAASGDAADAAAYVRQRTNIQNAVLNELWNGTFLRKFNSILYGTTIENSFVSALAGDWLARLTGLPRTMSTNLLQQENYQLITRHLKPFYPIPPMEVSPDGRRATGRCYHLQTLPYLGCESIYQNYVDDGLAVLQRTWECVWLFSQSPWNENLGYDAPNGAPEGFVSYMTSPCTWHVLNALSGVSVDVPDGILYVSPRLPSSMTELHLPLYLPRFWAQFDYVPAQSKLTLTVTQVFTDDPTVESTLFHAPGPYGTGPTNPIVLSAIAADGDAPLITLPQPFTVQTGAVLNLSSYLNQLAPGPAQTIPPGETTPVGKTVLLKAVANNMWVEAPNAGNNSLAADQSAPNVNSGSAQLFNVIDQTNGYVALQAVVNGKYVTAANGGSSPLIAASAAIGPGETFLLILDGPGRLALRAVTNNMYVTTNSGSTLLANAGSFPGGSTIGQVEQSEIGSGQIFQWSDAATASGLTAAPGNTQVALTWTPALNATNYNLGRSATSGGPYATIASVSTTSYTDTNVVNGLTYFYVVTAVSGGVEAPNSNEASAMPLVVAYAVNCGGSAAGSFAADAYYSPAGSTFSTSAAIDTGGVLNPAPQAVYQTERYKTLTYTFTGLAPSAGYVVRLHFSENYWTASGKRLFNVFINGTQVLSNFDIYLTADSQYRAVIEEFNTRADGSGQIAILFSDGAADHAKIDGIEIARTAFTAPPGVAGAGDNSFGQCALPLAATNIIAVAAGAWHSLALRTDGTVVAWGDDWDGQCDVPATLTNALAIAAGGYHSLAIKANGTVTAWGADDSGQTNVPANLTGVIGISAGTWHSVALRADGTVVAWGDNSSGQTNLPAGLSNVVAIAAGGNHNLALKADGTVAAWGENTDAEGNVAGQSVVPWGLTNVVAIGAGEYHSLAVQADGTVVVWGDDSQGQCDVPIGLSNVVAVAGGGAHTVALGSGGGVIAWGDDLNQQCELPAALPPAVGIAAGGYHTLVLLQGVVPVPQLLNPAFEGGRFSALVQSLNRNNYALQFKDSLAATNWMPLPGVTGNGALRSLSDPGAAAAQRFFRLSTY